MAPESNEGQKLVDPSSAAAESKAPVKTPSIAEGEQKQFAEKQARLEKRDGKKEPGKGYEAGVAHGSAPSAPVAEPKA